MPLAFAGQRVVAGHHPVLAQGQVGVLRVGWVSEGNPLVEAVVNAHELPPHPDRPVHRVGFDSKGLLDFVHQVERLAGVAVKLVDEGEDRNPPHLADLEELAGLRLDPLGAVDHHHGRVDGH